MNQKEKIERLDSFQNEKEFREFLIDLLKRIGFTNVYHTHRYGNPEFGKDIIAQKSNDFDGPEWYAFVVKKGRILGGSNEIETIKNQILQSFEYPYEAIDGRDIRINKVKVVTNESFSAGAIRSIRDSSRLKANSNFDFWWNEKLIEYIDSYYEDFWLPGDFLTKQYSRMLSTTITAEFELKELSITKLPDKKVKKLLDLFINPVLLEFKSVASAKHNKTAKTDRVLIDEIISSSDSFIIEGEPGSGKSRLINKLTTILLEPSQIDISNTFPIKIRLTTLRECNFDLCKAIKTEIGKFLPDDHNRIKYDSQKFIVLIDSVDDLYVSELQILIKNLKESILEKGCRFVISARLLDNVIFEGTHKKVRELHLQNFNGRQLTSFIQKYFEDSTRGEKLIEVLKESNILDKLPTTPLTITLISLLYEDTEYEIPATLTDIYNDFISVLLGKLEVKHKMQLMDLELKKRIFAHIAYKMLETKTFDLPKEAFVGQVNGFLKPKGIHLENDEDVFRILNRSGIIFIDSENRVGFKHMSFLEYFAAYECFYVKTDHSQLVSNFNDVNWQNATIFYAGISKEMPKLIDDLLKSVPNNTLRDWFINIGGFGYLAQALYMTDIVDRNRLIERALDNLVSSFEYLKEQTKQLGPYYNMPLHVLGAISSFWFTMNFKSVTLCDCLFTTYDSIVRDNHDQLGVNNFKTGFKLFLLASTLASKYLNKPEKFEDLFDKDCFIKDPLLIVLGDIFIDVDEIDGKIISQEKKKKIKHEIDRYRKLLVNITKKPAYRFSEDYSRLGNSD